MYLKWFQKQGRDEYIHASIMPYFGTIAEKKDSKTTLYQLHAFSSSIVWRCGLPSCVFSSLPCFCIFSGPSIHEINLFPKRFPLVYITRTIPLHSLWTLMKATVKKPKHLFQKDYGEKNLSFTFMQFTNMYYVSDINSFGWKWINNWPGNVNFAPLRMHQNESEGIDGFKMIVTFFKQ